MMLDFSTVVAISQVMTPVLLLIITGVGWYVRQSIERKGKLEEELREDRLEIYNKILEPFFVLLMTDAAWAADPKMKGKDKSQTAMRTMLSWEYKKTALQLSLIGSDGVVRAYSKLMQTAFHAEDVESPATETGLGMIGLLGDLLLEIRKGAGNSATKITNMGMLEWFLKDLPQE